MVTTALVTLEKKIVIYKTNSISISFDIKITAHNVIIFLIKTPKNLYVVVNISDFKFEP
jgi:hypothetical protein